MERVWKVVSDLWVCEYCGAYLDAGERCDCEEESFGDKKSAVGSGVPSSAVKSFSKCIVTDYKEDGKMKLMELRLNNFQGIKDVVINFDGSDVDIYGDNATGKTTVFNGITWLLFDKASTGVKNFSPKSKGPDGDVHNLEHSSEAVFCDRDGQFSIKKIFKEVYKKVKGSYEQSFSGHSTDYYVDGVPMSEREYNIFITERFGSLDLLKMLTMPSYFAEELDWKVRREVLLDVCGDFSDEAVIASNDALSDIISRLMKPSGAGKYAVDELRKILSVQKSDINKDLLTVPSRIDEAHKAIFEVNCSEDELKVKGVRLNAELARIEQKKAGIRDLSSDDVSKRAIAQLETKLAQARSDYNKANLEEFQVINEKIFAKKSELMNNSGELRILEGELARFAKSKSDMERKRSEIVEEYSKVSELVFDESLGICPTCNRELPILEIEALKAKFNVDKSERLLGLNARGKAEASRDMIAKVCKDIDDIGFKLDSKRREGVLLEKELGDLQALVVIPKTFEKTSEYAAIELEIDKLRATENNSGSESKTLMEALELEKSDIQKQIDELGILSSRLKMNKQQEDRVAELERLEKDLACKFEEAEKGIYLCDLFVKCKVDMLTDFINEKFSNVSFRLFAQQINGGLKEDCEVLVPGEGNRMVPYGFANNAARVNAGLEIIDVLGKHYGKSLPVVIDNAESVTHLRDMDSQVIRLVVSENDKNLRVEVR